MKTYAQAAEAIQRQHNGNRPFRAGTCLKQCRLVYGIGSKWPDAAAAWKNAKYKHVDKGYAPKGAFEFWLGGSEGHGHIAISAGGGHCWSIDIRRKGYWDLVPTTEIHEKWGQRYVGWSEDVNGKRVVTIVPASKWTHLRRQLLELLTSGDMTVSAKRGRSIRVFKYTALTLLKKTPEH